MAQIFSLDGEPGMLELIGLIVKRAGYEHVYTTDSERALEILRTEPVDLFTQDITRPGIDGLEFYRHMRADKTLDGIPVVIITARIIEDIDEFCEMHFPGLPKIDGYVNKPFNPNALISTIERVLAERGKPLPTGRS